MEATLGDRSGRVLVREAHLSDRTTPIESRPPTVPSKCASAASLEHVLDGLQLDDDNARRARCALAEG